MKNKLGANTNFNPNTSALGKGKALTFAPVWTLILPIAIQLQIHQ